MKLVKGILATLLSVAVTGLAANSARAEDSLVRTPNMAFGMGSDVTQGQTVSGLPSGIFQRLPDIEQQHIEVAQLNPRTPIQKIKDTLKYSTVIVSEIPSTEFLQSYFDWVKGSGSNSVVLTAVFNNKGEPTQSGTDGRSLVTYSFGELRLDGNGNLVGDLTKLLSDRQFCPTPAPPGGFGGCAGEDQPFSIKEKATVGVVLKPDGNITWVEKSFGNWTYNYTLKCYNNDTASILGRNYGGIVTLQKVQNEIIK